MSDLNVKVPAGSAQALRQSPEKVREIAVAIGRILDARSEGKLGSGSRTYEDEVEIPGFPDESITITLPRQQDGRLRAIHYLRNGRISVALDGHIMIRCEGTVLPETVKQGLINKPLSELIDATSTSLPELAAARIKAVFVEDDDEFLIYASGSVETVSLDQLTS